MSVRRRLANRRASETFSLECGGLRYVATVSRFTDGSLGEIFVSNHRVDSQAGIMASDQAVLASLALQFGCPLDVLREAVMRDSVGRATSPIPVFRWVVFVDDASGFLVSDFSTKAARLAWSTFDVFGLARERPMERRDLAGLCWVLQHGRVVELFHDSATWVRGTSAFAHTRRRAPEGSVVLPWLIK